MDAISSSETSVATQQTTRRHIPEYDTLHNYRCENLKSYMSMYEYVLKKAMKAHRVVRRRGSYIFKWLKLRIAPVTHVRQY
jgi:hypothetical protein